MIQEKFNNNQNCDQGLKSPHWQEIIQAIINCKYSWACVLFLRFSGYEPSEYIPYKVYKQLVKENSSVNLDNSNYSHHQSVKSSIFRIY
ncbi:MAG: hypothetical protein EAZ87_09565 [Nostocales cyanobacterium]|nr:MAG: hypothetical protein EAZ87_09565 [Nostocales cyanobacterium]